MKFCSAIGCDKKHEAKGFCKSHYSRLRYAGTAELWRPDDPERRFWRHVDRSGECWLWIGCRIPKGYGQFYAGQRRMVRAHRFAYELAYGPLSSELHVCHSCDNPPCVRPSHLFAGTAYDNMRDRKQKGHYANQPRGEDNPNSKLTDTAVRRIRARRTLGLTLNDLAREYGVTIQAISLIERRKNWRHV